MNFELVGLVDDGVKMKFEMMLAENLAEREDGWQRLDLHARALMLLLEKERERVEGDRGYFDVLMRMLREDRAAMDKLMLSMDRERQEAMRKIAGLEAEKARLEDRTATTDKVVLSVHRDWQKAMGEIAGLEAEKARLEDKNARMLDDLDVGLKNAKELAAENARLRERVAGLEKAQGVKESVENCRD